MGEKIVIAVLAAASVLPLAGCRCASPVTALPPAELVATPTHLVLPPAYLGQRTVAVVDIANVGGATAVADVTLSAPFAADTSHLELARGDSARVEVAFAPTEAGPASAVLLVGALKVPVESAGLAVPACLPDGGCVEVHFDYGAAQCVSSLRPEASACAEACITQGQCASGRCVGHLRDCDDHDPCTLDTCGANGCASVPLRCVPPSDPCQVAACEGDAGCVVTNVADGTLCGDDDCVGNSLLVCIGGQCVRRQRPQETCPHGWVLGTVPGGWATLSYDEARGRTVLFDGSSRTTWLWGGAAWVQQFPPLSPPAGSYATVWARARQRVEAFGVDRRNVTQLWAWDGSAWSPVNAGSAPPPRSGSAVSYDAARDRLVVFGGSDSTGAPLSDTWEWDGVAWTQAQPPVVPPPRRTPAAAYDALRRRVVLFGGWDRSQRLSDTWEWDGRVWVAGPAQGPSARGAPALTWDPTSERLLLLGGLGTSPSAELWEYDGTTWTPRASSAPPGARYGHALAYDLRRQRVVLFGGLTSLPAQTYGVVLADTWEWDGATWQRRADGWAPPAGPTAYDEARARVVTFTGDSTWEWDGARWQRAAPAHSPPRRTDHALAYDPVRARVVMMGGGDSVNVLGDTWTWDGADWADVTPASGPAARAFHAMAWDGASQQVLLSGGWTNAGNSTALFNDSWRWSGTGWASAATASTPWVWQHAMAFDAARGRVVLVATDARVHTWEWDGATWTELAAARQPPSGAHALAYHPGLGRVLLFTGSAGPSSSDTWAWDGANWTPLAASTNAPPSGGWMAYDAARQRLMLIGDGTWVYVP